MDNSTDKIKSALMKNKTNSQETQAILWTTPTYTDLLIPGKKNSLNQKTPRQQ